MEDLLGSEHLLLDFLILCCWSDGYEDRGQYLMGFDESLWIFSQLWWETCSTKRWRLPLSMGTQLSLYGNQLYNPSDAAHHSHCGGSSNVAAGWTSSKEQRSAMQPVSLRLSAGGVCCS